MITTDQPYPDVTDVDMTYADVTERLFRRFATVHSLPVITAVLRQCRSELDCARPGSLPELLERLATQRLIDLRPTS